MGRNTHSRAAIQCSAADARKLGRGVQARGRRPPISSRSSAGCPQLFVLLGPLPYKHPSFENTTFRLLAGTSATPTLIRRPAINETGARTLEMPRRGATTVPRIRGIRVHIGNLAPSALYDALEAPKIAVQALKIAMAALKDAIQAAKNAMQAPKFAMQALKFAMTALKFATQAVKLATQALKIATQALFGRPSACFTDLLA